MHKTLVSILVLLALAASTAALAHAADAEPATETEIVLPLEEPLMTPAEDPEVPDLFDPGREPWEEKIRECEPDEAEQHCQPGCTCIYTIPKIYCFC